MLKKSWHKKAGSQEYRNCRHVFNSINSWLRHNSLLNLHLGFHSL